MITLKSDFDVEVIQQMGNDLMCANAAWVSTGKDLHGIETVHSYGSGHEGLSCSSSLTEFGKKVEGVLRFLVSKRHGTPFEQGAITLRVNVPIFIWREWHRHRIGFSYNEESGRYKQLAPVFYVPGEERRLHCIKPEGFKPSSPGWRGFLEKDALDYQQDSSILHSLYTSCYQVYEDRLKLGFDNGLARICLPVAIYSACYVTCNPRSLMAFLSLRVDDPAASYPSHPQWEMDQVARQVEECFQRYWPITHRLFVENGRVAP